MAKAAAVHWTHDRFEAVVVEGGLKRWRVLASDSGDLPTAGEGEDSTALASAAIAAALKKIGAPRDPLNLTFSSTGSVFRNLQLPFTGDEAIRKVLKFECEGQLHQFNIDDVIIAYLTVEETKTSTDMIIAATPKKYLRTQIDTLEKGGYDPLTVDIDAFALFNAIAATGAIAPDKSVLVFHLGREESLALSIEDGRLTLVRSMRLGYAAPKAAGAVKGEESVKSEDASATPRAPEHGPEGEEIIVTFDEAEAPASVAVAPIVETEILTHGADDLVRRLSREATRMIAADRRRGPDEILVSGEAAEIPGFIEKLGAALDLPARELDLFVNVDGAPAHPRVRRQLGFALGGALKGIGIDVAKTDFRQEELRFAKKLETLKIPLAALAASIAFTLLLQNIYKYREVEGKKNHLTSIAVGAERILMEVPAGSPTLAKKMKAIVTKYEKDPPLERLRLYSNKLDEEIKSLKDVYGSGGTSFLKPQSALEATQRIFEFLSKNEDDLGAFVLDKYSAITDTNNPQNSRVTVKPQMTFLGDGGEATIRVALMLRRLREQKWVAEAREGPSNPVNGGVSYDGLTIFVDLQRESANP